MIKVSFSECTYKGSKAVLMAYITSAMHHLLEEKIVTVDDLNKAVELAQKSEEDVSKEVEEMMEKNPEYKFLEMFLNTCPPNILDNVL